MVFPSVGLASYKLFAFLVSILILFILKTKPRRACLLTTSTHVFTPYYKILVDVTWCPGGGTPKKLGRGVRPASQNANHIYDQTAIFLPYL